MIKQSLGRLGEELACTYLKQRGYKILYRNFRLRGGEIDIIVSKGDLVLFVEVKTRTGTRYGLPEEAISYYKLLHLRKACEYFIAMKQLKQVDYRLDAIVIELGESNKVKRIEHIQNILQ